jgi:hypothetical protein
MSPAGVRLATHRQNGQRQRQQSGLLWDPWWRRQVRADHHAQSIGASICLNRKRHLRKRLPALQEHGRADCFAQYARNPSSTVLVHGQADVSPSTFAVRCPQRSSRPLRGRPIGRPQTGSFLYNQRTAWHSALRAHLPSGQSRFARASARAASPRSTWQRRNAKTARSKMAERAAALRSLRFGIRLVGAGKCASLRLSVTRS